MNGIGLSIYSISVKQFIHLKLATLAWEPSSKAMHYSDTLQWLDANVLSDV